MSSKKCVNIFKACYLSPYHLLTDRLQYTPAYNKERPARLEFLFTLPARSKAKISMEFEKVFQDWMQHPPDAHHGFYMSSSVVSGMVPYNEQLVETIPSLQTSLLLSRFGYILVYLHFLFMLSFKCQGSRGIRTSRQLWTVSSLG